MRTDPLATGTLLRAFPQRYRPQTTGIHSDVRSFCRTHPLIRTHSFTRFHLRMCIHTDSLKHIQAHSLTRIRQACTGLHLRRRMCATACVLDECACFECASRHVCSTHARADGAGSRTPASSLDLLSSRKVHMRGKDVGCNCVWALVCSPPSESETPSTTTACCGAGCNVLMLCSVGCRP